MIIKFFLLVKISCNRRENEKFVKKNKNLYFQNGKITFNLIIYIFELDR